MQGAACICRDAERFQDWLNFFWRTGEGLLGCNSLALPLKVIGSDSCILAEDHLLWHSRWSHWRQQCRAHTCTCQAYLYSLQRVGGGYVEAVGSEQSAFSLLASKVHFTPRELRLRRHPHLLHVKDGMFVSVHRCTHTLMIGYRINTHANVSNLLWRPGVATQ